MTTVHSVDELKSLIDPLAVYQEYVRLTRRGKRSTGLCPFHKEKTPSFSVDADNGLFYCFGCHKGGDLIQFLQEIESCSFPEALEVLARKAGVTLESRGSRTPDQAPDRKERLRKVLECAAAFFRESLDASGESSPVKAYTRKRGIREETAARLQLGYAPNGGLMRHLSRNGFKADEGQEAGLLVERRRGEWAERFHNRLIFPIQDIMGRTVGFGGRALGSEEPKYYNSPESPVFQKRELLYGLNLTKGAVRAKEQIVLTEGYMDFLAVTQAGVENAAATLGTALAEGQVRLIKRYAREVILNFDQDAAGLAAAQRAIQLLLAEGLRIRVSVVPNGKDPDEYIKMNGAEAYRKLLGDSLPFFDFLVERSEEELARGGVPAKMNFLDDLLPYLLAVADPIERQEYAKEISSRTGIEAALILKRLAREKAHVKGDSPAGTAPRSMEVPIAEQVIVKGAMTFPDVAKELVSALPEDALNVLSVGPLLAAIMEQGAPQGGDQTALLAYIQNSCHEAPTESDFANAVNTVLGVHLKKRERQIQHKIKEASLRKDFGLIQILNREKISVLEQIQSLERSGSR
jgi:DNA primase